MRLQRVFQDADGAARAAAAEGDGLRRQWLDVVTTELLDADPSLFRLAPRGGGGRVPDLYGYGVTIG